eukprot:Nitzschia sp. Nitz4//scaffold184_size43902//37547//39466//NITZ4_007290-RA/size43902-processed-gene-0.19-mRNA-1//-1//CDS//3329539675//3402//frame0
MVISGIIRPPQEIRVVADKTASMVAKNGRGFEEKILKSARGQTPKFAFLQPTSPFHAYYEHQVQLCLSGGKEEEESKSTTTVMVDKENHKDSSGGTTDSKPAAVAAKNKGTKGATVRKQSSRQQASAIDPIARALLQQRNKVTQSSSTAPKEASNEQQGHQQQVQPPTPLNLLGLVAPDFAPAQLELCQLAAQMTAIQPAFLPMLTSREWSNPQFAFLQPRHAHFAYFSSLVDTYKHLLANYKEAATLPKEEASLLQVLDQAAYRAEYDRFMSSNAAEEGEVVAIDWHDFVVVETIDFAPDETVELSLLPPPPSSTITTTTTATVGGDDDDGEVIRVVPTYKPKVVSTTLANRAVDPITGASVSVADSSEHMRIQLLDPAWAKERQIFQDKQKDSNLVSGDAMVQNLSRLTQNDDAAAKPKRPLELPNPSNQATVAAPPMQAAAAAAQFDQGRMAKRPRTDGPMGATSIPPPPPPPPVAPPMMQQQQQQQHVPSAPPGMIPPPPPPGMAPPGMDPYASQGMMGMAADDSVAPAAAPEVPVSKDPLPPVVTLQIRIPNDPTQMAWNFYGQILPLQMPVQSLVKQVKSELSQKHLNGMPVNKIQFKDAQSGFLKDTRTLDDILTSPSATWELVPKTRGGRR